MKKSIYCLSTLCIAIGLGLTSCNEEEISNYMQFTAFDMNFRIISVENQTCEVCRNPGYWGSITIPRIVTYQGHDFMVTQIGNAAFINSQVTSVSIPSSVTNIGRTAFMSCSSLTYIDLPNSLISIDEGAFQNCTNLQSVRIPNSVTTISNAAFFNCTELTEVSIPNSVTTIGYNVFAHCNLKEMVFEDGENALETNYPLGVCTIETLYVGRNINSESDLGLEKLSKLIIGKQLTSMPSIKSCYDLESIYLMPNNPPAAQGFSTYQYENVRVYVPEGRLFAYQSDNVWSRFKNMSEFDPSSLSVRYNSSKQDL